MPRTKVNPVQRVALQRRIAAARASEKPIPWAVIAAQEGHPVRTLQHMHQRWLEQQAAYDDPLGLIEHALNLYDEMMERLGEEIAHADHASARVGAVRTLMDLLARRLNLLILVGRMPRNMSDYTDFPKVQQMLIDMAGVLEKHNVGVEAIDDMLAIVERADTQAAASGVALSKRHQ
jgi:hypothetical protein